MEIFFDPRDLMISDLQPGRGGGGAQSQYMAFDTQVATALAELINDLLNTAVGIGIVGLIDV